MQKIYTSIPPRTSGYVLLGGLTETPIKFEPDAAGDLCADVPDDVAEILLTKHGDRFWPGDESEDGALVAPAQVKRPRGRPRKQPPIQ